MPAMLASTLHASASKVCGLASMMQLFLFVVAVVMMIREGRGRF